MQIFIIYISVEIYEKNKFLLYFLNIKVLVKSNNPAKLYLV